MNKLDKLKSDVDNISQVFKFDYGTPVTKGNKSSRDFENEIIDTMVTKYHWSPITNIDISLLKLPKDATEVEVLKSPDSDRVFILFKRFDNYIYYRKGSLDGDKLELMPDSKKAFIDFGTVKISDDLIFIK